MGEILAAKQRGNKIRIIVARRQRSKYADPLYKKNLNPVDSNDLARFFNDLDLRFNSPIEKAFKKYKRRKSTELEDQFFLWEQK